MKIDSFAFVLALSFVASGTELALAQDRVVVAGQDGVAAPKRTKTIQPVYPQEALAQGIRGIVILEILIDTQGQVSSADVIRSIPGLDEAALTAIRKWEYEVTKIDGQPVSVKLTVPITFAVRLPEVTRAPGIPELRQGASIAYPAGQSEGSSVTAEVTLARDGQVAEAEVTKGDAPWTQALLQALRTWRFASEGDNVTLAFRVEADFVPGKEKGRVDVRLTGLRRSESTPAPGPETASSAPDATNAPAAAPPSAPTAAPDTPPASGAPPVPIVPVPPDPIASPPAPAPSAADAPPASSPPATAPAAPANPPSAPATPSSATTPPTGPPTAPTASAPSTSAPAAPQPPSSGSAPAPEPPIAPPATTPSSTTAAPPSPTTTAPRTPAPVTGPPAPTNTRPGSPSATDTPPGPTAPPVEVITAPRPPGADVAPPPSVPGVSAIRDVTLAMGVPDLVRGRRPVPPPIARMTGTTGTVEVKFGVDAAGVTSVTEATGPDELKTAATYTVQSWFFRRVTAERLHLVVTFDFAGEVAKGTVRSE